MKVIGITGGIGTGKSSLLHLLSTEYRAYIVEADKLAHKMMLPEGELYQCVVKTFGRQIVKEDKMIDRAVLGKIVFQDGEALRRLNGIVHPAVKAYIQKDIVHKRRDGKTALYVIEAALLIEDGYRAICDELWYVCTPKEERIKRLLDSRGGSRQKWENIIANQSSEDSYKSNCDVVIDNGGSLEKTANLVKELLSKSI